MNIYQFIILDTIDGQTDSPNLQIVPALPTQIVENRCLELK